MFVLETGDDLLLDGVACLYPFILESGERFLGGGGRGMPLIMFKSFLFSFDETADDDDGYNLKLLFLS